MTNDIDHTDKPHEPAKTDSSLGLIVSMADTTWRMFTPPAIVVPIGIFADNKLGTGPWLTLLCVPVGLALSALLIKKQLGKDQ